MKELYLVSIITPAYNCAETIKDVYKSILSQTYKNWEWIVCDDSSSDATSDIVREIASKDKRVKLIKTDFNMGAAHSRNAAIRDAQGRFIAFLDSDDKWLPLKLEHQIKFMLDNKYAFTYTNYYVKKPNGKTILFSPSSTVISYKNLLLKNDIGCLTAVYDVSVLGKVYMPIDSFKREDYAAWLDITKRGYKAYKLNENLAEYSVGTSSVSSNKFKMIKYQWRVYRKHEKMSFLRSLYYLVIHSFNKMFFKY